MSNFTPAWFKKGFFNESLFCDDFLSSHQLLYSNGAFFTPDGRMVDPMPLRCEIFEMMREYVGANLAKKVTNVVDVLKLAAQVEDFPPVTDRIALANGTLYLAGTFQEGVAIMHYENVGVSITGNSTNPTRFQHPVAGTYKKECIEQGKKYFSVASGGGTGRTLHPDNMGAGPASYGMTDTMGRMHSDAQFAGSSSVPAHVEMMGLIGMGNNPMVGATVAVAVSVEEAANAGKF